MPLKNFRKTEKKNRKENNMNKIRMMSPLIGFCIPTSLCHAETVHMDMTIEGPATKQPNKQYEVPRNGVIKFTAQKPKMPKRNEEIWIFQWIKLEWFLDGVPQNASENNASIAISLNPQKAPRQINVQSLLTYDYLQKGTETHSKDYGKSDLVILNFIK